MTDLVQDTLYIPMKGRVYCSFYHKDFFYDEKACMIYNLQEKEKKIFDGNEFNYIASANRTKRIDLLVKEFLKKNPFGTVVNLGCGLDDLFGRNDNKKAMFYEIDLEEVMEARKAYFKENKRDIMISSDMFDLSWTDELKKDKPILIIISGFIYFYKEGKFIRFLNELSSITKAEVIFDSISSFGLRRANKKMKKNGVKLLFSIDEASDFVNKCNCRVSLITENDLFSNIDNNLYVSKLTKIKMKISDKLGMMKLIRISLT